MTTNILFAENNSRTLKIRTKWLENEGYSVLPASNPNEARGILRQIGRVDLAIVDVRLVDDKSGDDESGLNLAFETSQYSIPTIIVTAFPKYEYVRRAQSLNTYRSAPDITFIDAEENEATFIQVVKNSLKKRNIFIVHGHDDDARRAVELFIKSDLLLEPIVLINQPQSGPTIFQQLENYSNVAYVIALLTPDDSAISSGKKTKRARQNVIFELGYFIGKYGTKRVKALVADDVEIPSDLHGLLYIPFDKDKEDWKVKLVQEMRSVGLDIHYP